MSSGAKPLHDENLTEDLISSELIFKGRFLQIQRDIVLLPSTVSAGGNAVSPNADSAELRRAQIHNSQASREYIKHPGAVMIIPLLDDGRVVVERQYRHPLRQIFTEFPAGRIEHGESPAATAVRELREETGYQAAQIGHFTTIHNAIAYSDERIELYLARGLSLGARSLDDGEFINTEIVTTDWLQAELRAGRLSDVKTQIGLSWLLSYKCGEIPWPTYVPSASIEV